MHVTAKSLPLFFHGPSYKTWAALAKVLPPGAARMSMATLIKSVHRMPAEVCEKTLFEKTYRSSLMCWGNAIAKAFTSVSMYCRSTKRTGDKDRGENGA